MIRNTTIAIIARLLPMLALFSCAIPSLTVVEPPTPPEKKIAKRPSVKPKVRKPAPKPVSKPEIPSLSEDSRIRLPDMVTMPSDEEFRATTSSLPSAGPDAGAVIARPPKSPPSQPEPINAD